MTRAILALTLLLAAPATAQLAPTLSAAVTICTAAGGDIPSRTAALVDAGWSAATEATLPTAAAALAILPLIERMTISSDVAVAERTERLTAAGDLMATRARDFRPDEALLQAPDGTAIWLQTTTPGHGRCDIAAPLTAKSLAPFALIRADVIVADLLQIEQLTLNGNAEAYLHSYATGTFGTPDPLPILSITFALTD